MTTEVIEHPAARRRASRVRLNREPARPATPPALIATTGLVAALVLVLPLMMGHRTAATLSASLMVLVWLAALAAAGGALSGQIQRPPRGWLVFAGLLTGLVTLQVLPLKGLAALFGPYPDPLWQQPGFSPLTWSPDIGASLRGWAAFIALFTLAWLAASLPRQMRMWLWLAVVAMALFQGLYGLLSHATGSDTVLGIWPRNNPGFVHGSFSNRNLFAAYLALTWPLAVGIWYMRKVPGLSRLPLEVRIAGSLISGAIIGAAMLGSASRLGSAAGVGGILLALLLWGRHRQMIHGASAWPAYAAAGAALLGATWYGLTPLAERLLATSGEEARLEVFAIVITEFPRAWWLHGVGLGGFEAVFKQFQPAAIGGWFDYLHNDLLQWLIETGLVGLGLLLAVVAALWRNARLSTERIALYSGLGALSMVALGDFSWHIPATQVVLAIFIGTLLARR
ncbi:MAG: O-antigen ligase family protein [Wenzhouxiangella sp.]